MQFLTQAKKPTIKPPMITIVGSPGTGKTTLGALFPEAIILPTEDGTSVFENWAEENQPAVLPRARKAAKDEAGNLIRSTRADLNQLLDELMTADHGYKTFVVDSITTLDKLFGFEIMLRDDVKTVADAAGGWHKGYDELASWHADFIYKCEQLRAVKKMAIVFLAHTGIKKIRNRPDAVSDYSVFSMEMDAKSISIYTSQSDAVAYLTKEQYVIGAETHKKTGAVTKYGKLSDSGQRKLVTTGDGQVGYIDAKNRYDFPPELLVNRGENPMLQYIKFFNVKGK